MKLCLFWQIYAELAVRSQLQSQYGPSLLGLESRRSAHRDIIRQCSRRFQACAAGVTWLTNFTKMSSRTIACHHCTNDASEPLRGRPRALQPTPSSHRSQSICQLHPYCVLLRAQAPTMLLVAGLLLASLAAQPVHAAVRLDPPRAVAFPGQQLLSWLFFALVVLTCRS